MFSYIWQMFLFAIWSYCIFQCLLKPPWSLCSYLQHNELVSAGTELSKCALAYSRLWRKSIQFLCQPLATIYQNNTALQNDRRSRTDKKICFHSENTPVLTNFKKHFMHLVDLYMLKTQGLQLLQTVIRCLNKSGYLPWEKNQWVALCCVSQLAFFPLQSDFSAEFLS